MQQVNFYLAQYPDKQKKAVSKKLLLFILLISVSIIGGVSFSLWKLQSLKNQLALETSTLKVVEGALSKLKSATEKSASEDELKVKLLELKDQVKHKQAVKAEIDTQIKQNLDGFSEHFRALARQDSRGIWLTNIFFENSVQQITLEGMASTPEQVAKYIRRLATEPVFSGVSFVGFEIEQIKNKNSNTKLLAFKLSTHEIEEEIVEQIGTPLENYLEAKAP